MMNGTSNWQVVLTEFCTLGESPVWDDRLQRILWVDIIEGHVHEWYTAARRHVMTHFPVKIGAIALIDDGAVIAASDEGFVFLDLRNRGVKRITDPESRLADNRFNDGKCDAVGRFWAGTMDEVTGKKGAGSLYSLDKDGRATRRVNNVTCSNGLAWSLDHQTLFYIDTGTHQVQAFDFELETGRIANPRAVIDIPESEGWPDGMTIDAAGMLWIAFWGGWKVARWNPYTGEKLSEIKLPVAQITSCTFGGKNLKDLYITSANIGLTDAERSAQRLAGSLFVVDNLDVGGIGPSRYVQRESPSDFATHTIHGH
ncbi:regucalcin-like protein [Parapedobacter pyrenivorans]|uniref:Regucalcin n=1 Tax=Parapedobacter pyrenivorans TaxID=1305674 RepID=A0A917I2N1_9SPHI|nr:SMP-30/gluconolactonase/LRE family protein [Parapedobacter pyrenivorans]GGH03783.1 regucalcin-like protein [Parapedobacter pyrenivorans]